MKIEKYSKSPLSPWMNEEAYEDTIVLSTRVRLARNINGIPFPGNNIPQDYLQNVSSLLEIDELKSDMEKLGTFDFFTMGSLNALEKRVLVEKHLISPLLTNHTEYGACYLSENENISVMINEEDHIRIQCLSNGLQVEKTLDLANTIDDILEKHLDYAFSETKGYLTSCPTNVGTGLRASIMMHLPCLVMIKQLPKIIPTINQLGFVVRGLYGEGSEALGNVFQISNQITLGKSEKDICEDLEAVVLHLIKQEHEARSIVYQTSPIVLQDKIYRSLGVLTNARIIESKEAANSLSDVRLGIDLGIIKHISKNILNELLTLTQPGFLQLNSGAVLQPHERDVKRATLIRERINVNE